MKGFDPSTGLGFVQDGDYIEVTLPYDRNPGEGVLVGTMFGISVDGGLQGEVKNIHREGVYGLVAASGGWLWADETRPRPDRASRGGASDG
jgi:predicted RecA/RadA family phage recombinase